MENSSNFADELDLVFMALADPSRRTVLARLASGGEQSVGRASADLDLSPSGVSKHIKVLQDAGLIRRRVVGRQHLLSLESSRLVLAEDWIDRCRTLWTQRSLDVDQTINASPNTPQENVMPDIDTLASALAQLQGVIESAPLEANADAPTPCDSFTVGELTEHCLGTMSFLINAAGGQPPQVDGSLSDRFRAMSDATIEAWRARGLEGTIRLGPDDVPAMAGVGIGIMEGYVHAWDLSKALGLEFAPDEDLSAQALQAAKMVVTDDARGAEGDAPFHTAFPIADDADTAAHVVAHTGRDPEWSAS